MYKVFKDNWLFILADSNDIPHIADAITICITNAEDVIRIISGYDTTIDSDTIIVLYSNLGELITVFENNYLLKVAAGGWVFNNIGDVMMIDRLNYWDIPKGHIEKNETLQICAIREVEEETGIANLSIVEELGISRHLFRYSEGSPEILKVTHWFRMYSNYSGTFNPQISEGVEKVEWVSSDRINEYLYKSYRSLQEFYFDEVE
ncbi:MAG: hypothetical protein DRI86_07570 [Bacteroidetes bacterium]|nr:MAG: hypothetical protein DRI86_07570 [Bacteroidota bacterium]